MYIVSYLTQHNQNVATIRERLAFAESPVTMVTAATVPDLIHQAQSLPLNAVIADSDLPRAIWSQVRDALRIMEPSLPILALSTGPTASEWWHVADDLLRLDDPLELFLYRLSQRIGELSPLSAIRTGGNGTHHPNPQTGTSMANSIVLPKMPSLLENGQFRQFAEILSSRDETSVAETFVAWVQQACQATRVVMLLREPTTGEFTCRAHRGLSSALLPSCRFSQLAPLCRWLASAGYVLVKDDAAQSSADVMRGLDLMQAIVAIPMMCDGQLTGILGLGPRVVGQQYSAVELESLFALGAQIAIIVHHHRVQRTMQAQQEVTAHMLGVMPIGTVVLGADDRVTFANTAAANILGLQRSDLHGVDLRALPSPLGDIAYEARCTEVDVPRRELTLPVTGHPVAVTGLSLKTTPRSALILLEDLLPQHQLEDEKRRRQDLEVATNLVHYVAHELRNPLVALATFSNMVTSHADDEDFHEFCDTVLRDEINRINLFIEQLIILSQSADFHFAELALGTVFNRITTSCDLQRVRIVGLPKTSLPLYGDEHRLEIAIACILRTYSRLAADDTVIDVSIEAGDSVATITLQAEVNSDVPLECLMNPWEQLIGEENQDIDLGLATAKYIFEQHHGMLTVNRTARMLTSICQLPLSSRQLEREGVTHGSS